MPYIQKGCNIYSKMRQHSAITPHFRADCYIFTKAAANLEMAHHAAGDGASFLELLQRVLCCIKSRMVATYAAAAARIWVCCNVWLDGAAYPRDVATYMRIQEVCPGHAMSPGALHRRRQRLVSAAEDQRYL